jgi:hypothetical protein
VWQSIGKDCTVILVERRADNIWLPMALARHDVLGGNFHFDWFLGRIAECADDDARVVRTMRCHSRIDVSLAAEGWFYLHLGKQHQLSQGRGVVTPIARGGWRTTEAAVGSANESIELRWDADPTIRRCCITPPPRSRLLTLD